MKQPHKHAEIIKAWADGAEIEFLDIYSEWRPIGENPMWGEKIIFRIKPEPDLVYYGVIEDIGKPFLQAAFTKLEDDGDHLKLTFDGETGKLKSAEVL